MAICRLPRVDWRKRCGELRPANGQAWEEQPAVQYWTNQHPPRPSPRLHVRFGGKNRLTLDYFSGLFCLEVSPSLLFFFPLLHLSTPPTTFVAAGFLSHTPPFYQLSTSKISSRIPAKWLSLSCKCPRWGACSRRLPSPAAPILNSHLAIFVSSFDATL